VLCHHGADVGACGPYYGYSLAFDTTGMEQGVVNFSSSSRLDKAFLSGVTVDARDRLRRPEVVVYDLPD